MQVQKNPNIHGAQKLDSLHFMVIPLHSLPSSFPPSREVNCKQIYKSQHCFSALKQSGTIIPCLYKHNFALLECTADEVYASTQGSSASHPSTRAGCVSEGHLGYYQAQRQSLQPANFVTQGGRRWKSCWAKPSSYGRRKLHFLPPCSLL